MEEQEKIFLQQATQVNAWDRLLIDNGEKVRSPLNIGYFNFRSKHFGYNVTKRSTTTFIFVLHFFGH